MHNFKTFSDYDLAEWFCQYGDGQAGYYPGLRRTRNAAAKELIYRGINPGKIRRPLSNLMYGWRGWKSTKKSVLYVVPNRFSKFWAKYGNGRCYVV
jgi:hypothetical protein